jgi:hypothetical protein
MPGELILRGFAREAAVPLCLIFGKKSNWHPQADFKGATEVRGRLPSSSVERARGCP